MGKLPQGLGVYIPRMPTNSTFKRRAERLARNGVSWVVFGCVHQTGQLSTLMNHPRSVKCFTSACVVQGIEVFLFCSAHPQAELYTVRDAQQYITGAEKGWIVRMSASTFASNHAVQSYLAMFKMFAPTIGVQSTGEPQLVSSDRGFLETVGEGSDYVVVEFHNHRATSGVATRAARMRRASLLWKRATSVIVPTVAAYIEDDKKDDFYNRLDTTYRWANGPKAMLVYDAQDLGNRFWSGLQRFSVAIYAKHKVVSKMLVLS